VTITPEDNSRPVIRRQGKRARTPTVLQMEAVNWRCRPGVVLGYHGPGPLEVRLRRLWRLA
jgi:hypothetical protein